MKVGSFVRVKSTGCISILIDIQKVQNRYQLHGVSGWQYGVDDLEYLDNHTVLSEIDRLQQDRDKLIEGLREIDTHIRSTPEPVQHIVETLKRVLPEYQEGVTVE